MKPPYRDRAEGLPGVYTSPPPTPDQVLGPVATVFVGLFIAVGAVSALYYSARLLFLLMYEIVVPGVLP